MANTPLVAVTPHVSSKNRTFGTCPTATTPAWPPVSKENEKTAVKDNYSGYERCGSLKPPLTQSPMVSVETCDTAETPLPTAVGSKECATPITANDGLLTSVENTQAFSPWTATGRKSRDVITQEAPRKTSTPKTCPASTRAHLSKEKTPQPLSNERIRSFECDLRLTEASYDVIKSDFVLMRKKEKRELDEMDNAAMSSMDELFDHMGVDPMTAARHLERMVGQRCVTVKDALRVLRIVVEALECVVADGVVTQEELALSTDIELLAQSGGHDLISLHSLGTIIRKILNARIQSATPTSAEIK